ncbi:MAG: VCBS repeat-containing protein, partial [Acidobacteriaceae bacterium]|nr:VCBS repeat-containing protein [Acidobacteriaceae bacterium]
KVEVGILVTATEPQAEDALRQLKAGADFRVLAREKSTDPTSNDGGSMGELDPAQLRPELADALKGLRPGQYSAVVHIPAGFAVLTVLPPGRNTPEMNQQRIQELMSSGAVRFGINVAGNVEENAAFADYPKPEGWERDLKAVCRIRRESHTAAVERLSAMMTEAEGTPGKFSPMDMMQGHGALSQLFTFVGDMDQAIDQAKAAYQIAATTVPQAAPILAETVGALYLHKSEEENGIYRDSTDQDIFPPPRPGARFAKPDDSRQAIQYFLKSLEQKPEDYEVRWLLNLAYMTLGEYPAGAPPAYRIPLSAFESKQNVGRFTDVAKAAGLNVFSEAGGVIVEDFDNDGLLDVVTSSMDVCEPLHYFHNNGDGTFTDRGPQAGLADQLGGLNIVGADYNNDGCMDILVLRGGWEFPVRKSLLKNNCDGTFTDVTQASGLNETVTRTQTGAWADIDNDGFLDLFIGNENAPSQLFRNKGDGTFEDISHAAGIDKTAYTKGVAAADYDNDGYVDFYVSNVSGANCLYHSNHDRTFTDIAKQAGVQSPWVSFATWFFDYDNDGWPDLFVTSYFQSVDEPVRSAVGLPVHVETLKLYRNLHNGAFEDVTAEAGLDKVFIPMGSNFGDIDNDGYLDIYLGQGQPSFTGMLPHVLFRNDAGKKFVDVTASSGTGELHKGHGVAFADLERSGHEDIVAETGGAIFSDKHTMRVFENPGNDNDWINVRLIGVKSNRSAVGAEIKVTVEDDGGSLRSIYRRVGNTSSFGQNPLEQHIGLGHGAHITALDVWWPASNRRQHFTHVDKNEFIEIREFASTFSKLDRKPVRLGGSKVVAR